MIPLTDLANLNMKRMNTTWRYTSYGDFEVFTTKKIAKGEEIFETYGNKDNETIYKQYGFVLDENPNKVSKLTNEKCQMLKPAIEKFQHDQKAKMIIKLAKEK